MPIGGLSDHATNVVTNYRADTSEMRREIRGLRGEQKRHAEEQLRQQEEQNRRLDRQISLIKGVGTAAAGIMGTLGAVHGTMEAIHAQREQFIEEERLRFAAAGANVEGLRDALGGAVTEMEALRFAAQATGGEFDLTQQQLEQAAEAAQILARRTGQDTEEALEEMAKALIGDGVDTLSRYGLQLEETAGTQESFHEILRETQRIASEGMDAVDDLASRAIRSAERQSGAWEQMKESVTTASREMLIGELVEEELLTISRSAQSLQNEARVGFEELQRLDEAFAEVERRRDEIAREARDDQRWDRELVSAIVGIPEPVHDAVVASRIQREEEFADILDRRQEVFREAFSAMAGDAVEAGQSIGKNVLSPLREIRDIFREDPDPDRGLSGFLRDIADVAEEGRQAQEAAERYEELSDEFRTLEERLDESVAKQRDFAEAQQTLNRAVSAGITTQQRANQLLDQKAQNLGLVEERLFGVQRATRDMAREFESIPEPGAGAIGMAADRTGRPPDAPPQPEEPEAQIRGQMDQIFGVQRADEIDMQAEAVDRLSASFGALEDSVGRAFSAWISGSESMSDVLQRELHEFATAESARMAILATKHGGMAIGQAALGNLPAAGAHGTAAAQFAAGAALAGAFGAATRPEDAPDESAEPVDGGGGMGGGARGEPAPMQVFMGGVDAETSARERRAIARRQLRRQRFQA